MKRYLMRKGTTFTSPLILLALIFFSCAKEKPYDVEYKEAELLTRNDIVTEETVTLEDGTTVTRPIEYLYVPMTLGTPMNVKDADPFYQGQEKVVRLAWSKKGLEVLQIEKDNRFQENSMNEYPVLTIPGDYKDFKCREDAYGDCTNVEEEDTEKEWYQKQSFLPEFEKIEVQEINELNIYTLSKGSCLKEESNKLIDYEMKAGVINIELETSYKVNSTNIACFIRSLIDEELETNGFRVRKFFSIVRLDSLASKDYETIVYPDEEHSHFGFFKREEYVLNDELDRRRKDKVSLMERWNPKRKNNELVYYLSPEYSKKENAYILEATQEAVFLMNREMGAANVPFKIKLIEQPDPKTAVSPGDLRYNSLVLIEDPLANGLLGYAPSVSNPYTGEIVKAHTNMYLGVLKGTTRYVYESAVDLSEDEYEKHNPSPFIKNDEILISPEVFKDLPRGMAIRHFPGLSQARIQALSNALRARQNQGNNPTSNVDLSDNQGENEEQGEEKSGPNLPKKVLREVPMDTILKDQIIQRMAYESKGHNLEISKEELNQLMLERVNTGNKKRAAEKLIELKASGKLTPSLEMELKEQARLDRYAENNALATEFFPIGGTSKVIYPELLAIPNIQTEKGTLKRWTELSQAQKSAAERIIVKSSYKATLVHELGHNLGLRHNFMGSFDKDNFYFDDEAVALGMNAAPAYSSIMDYSFSDFNQLKAFGKYDLAALRYGYAREVEVVANMKDQHGDMREIIQIKPIKTTLSDIEKELPENWRLKNYLFCTDENAGLSTICNRFDEGTTFTEIVTHLWYKYEDGYKYRNFRDGRHKYSAYNLPSYINARKREFSRVRDIIEDYEFFVGLFGEDLMKTGCHPDYVTPGSACEAIRDRINAVSLAGKMFLAILSEPDHICGLANPEKPNVIVEYRKLYDIYTNNRAQFDEVPRSCFHPKVEELLANPRPTNENREPKPMIAVSEVGRFLNGFKDSDPEFRYVTDRYVLGTWPDKVLAARALFQRSWDKANTDDTHYALVDIPQIQQELDMVYKQYLVGSPLEDSMLHISTLKDGRKARVPYVISKKDTINTIEDTFAFMRKDFGLPIDGGKGNIIGAVLSQIERKIDYGVDFEGKAFLNTNALAVIKEEGFVSPSDIAPNNIYYYDEFSRKTYIANKWTDVAYELIDSINMWNDLLKDVDPVLAYKVFEHRVTKPQAPIDVTGSDRFIWENLPLDVLRQLISLKNQGADLDERRLRESFGEIEGLPDAMVEFYKNDAEYMESLLERIKSQQETPYEGATEIEKALFEVNLAILGNFVSGVLEQKTVDEYINQLRRLPEYSKVVGR